MNNGQFDYTIGNRKKNWKHQTHQKFRQNKQQVCKKPEQNKSSWSGEESSSRYYDLKRKGHASRTVNVAVKQINDDDGDDDKL